MKKLSTLFALFMLCIGQTFAYDFEVGGIYYDSYGEEVLVTWEENRPYSGDVIIPATVTHDGITYNVKGIEGRAFSWCSDLVSVTIPEGATSIGEYAFENCENLISVTIPSTIESIGESAFAWCSNLTSVTIPEGVTSIEDCTFQDCWSLESVTIPSTMENIGGYAFSNCSNLTSVTIPEGVTSIGESAFENCAFTSITIPSSMESIGAGVFYSCGYLTSITIPNSVTSIGASAFYGCGFTSVTIPNSVTSIGDNAFEYCTELTSITIPSSVESIGEYAFANCETLTDFYNYATTPQTITDNVFSTYDGTTLHVQKGYEDVYRNADVWKEFYKIEDIALVIDFTDGEEYTLTEEKEYDELSYARTFSSNDWQALYVPFSMTYDDWKDYMDVYDIYNVLAYDEDNDGVIERTTVNMIRLKAGAVTEPNYPYVMRAKNTGAVEITLEGATLYPAEENSIYCCSTKQKFTFTGNYKKLTGLYTKGSYALQGGVLKTAVDDDVELNPQRWYMDVTNQDGSPMTAATRIFLNPFGEEDEVEGVKGVAVNIIGEETTYDMGGRSVNTTQLPKGLYVRGGKKIIVR